MRTSLVVAAGLVAVMLWGCAGTGNSPLQDAAGSGSRAPRSGGAGGSGSGDGGESGGALAALRPDVVTEAVPADADDPAVWIHPSDPGKSLILGTDKVEVEGGLYVFNLDGQTVQKFTGIDRPNNVDVEYGFELGGKTVDLAVLTERKKNRLRVFAIDRGTGTLTDVTGETRVFADSEGEGAEPMGIGLYRRGDGAIFAVVAPKTGPLEGYLGQYRLVARAGKVDAERVRRFGAFSGLTAEGEGEIEAIYVDDALGRVIYADELKGIRVYAADPEAPEGGKELALFGTEGYTGDREGLGVYETGAGTGYLLSTDQIPGGSRLYVYPREGLVDGVKPLSVVETPADSTDGIEVVSVSLGERFPKGAVVMMDSGSRTFQIYDWRKVFRHMMAGRAGVGAAVSRTEEARKKGLGAAAVVDPKRAGG